MSAETRWRPSKLEVGLLLVTLALGSGVCAPLLRQLWRTQDPELAVGLHVAWVDGQQRFTRHTQLDPGHPAVWDADQNREVPLPADPWGRPWVIRGAAPRATVYSLGPDGADAAGGGDDVVLLSPRRSIYIDEDLNARASVYSDLSWLLGGLVLALGWLVYASSRVPRAAALPQEALRTAALCLPVAGFCLLALWQSPGLPRTLDLLGAELLPVTPVPPSWASLGGICLGSFCLALTLRLRPREPAAASPTPPSA